MENLSESFSKYLQAEKREAVHAALALQLEAAGLTLEGKLLKAHFEGHASIVCDNFWTTQPIALGSTPPADPQTGDCWFDPLELVLCTFVPATEDWAARCGGWYSTHPVRLWQYLGFVGAVRYSVVESHAFPLLQVAHFAGQDQMSFATNLYAYEAKAYSQWFGKTLIGEKILIAKHAMSAEKLSHIIPEGMLLWDQSTASSMEDQPLAYNLNTCDYEDFFDQLELELPEEDKLIYGEWERSPRVGFATYVEATGLSYAQDGSLYPFLKSDNVPVR